MKETIKPGERAFSLLLIAFTLWEISESLKMLRRQPGFSSYGALPFGLGVIMLICLLKIFFSDLKKPVEKEQFDNKFLDAIAYAFPKDIAIFIGMMVVYFGAMLVGVSFMIATPLFLLGSMCYLMRDALVKNILTTIALMVFIYVIFVLVFKVTLP